MLQGVMEVARIDHLIHNNHKHRVVMIVFSLQLKSMDPSSLSENACEALGHIGFVDLSSDVLTCGVLKGSPCPATKPIRAGTAQWPCRRRGPRPTVRSTQRSLGCPARTSAVRTSSRKSLSSELQPGNDDPQLRPAPVPVRGKFGALHRTSTLRDETSSFLQL